MGRKKRTSAAEFFAGFPESPAPAFDAWPPADWFVGQDETGQDGKPFDWAAPPANFAVEDAFRWVSRVHTLYRHWDVLGWSWTRANSQTSSALTNAYLLVDDLRRRGLVPLAGFWRFGGEMDDCPHGFEVRELGRVRDWLGEALEHRRRVARLTADYGRGEVTIDGKTFQVGDIPAAIVHLLLTWKRGYSLPKMEPLVSSLLGGMPVSHLEREIEKLPDCVRAAIDSDNAGHFILPEYLG